jgi:hypothetical protein
MPIALAGWARGLNQSEIMAVDWAYRNIAVGRLRTQVPEIQLLRADAGISRTAV